MLNVNFNLRKHKSKKPEVIYLVLRWAGNYFRYTTKFKVLPSNWDKKKQRVKAVIDEPLKNTINKYLNEMEVKALKIYAEALGHNFSPTKEYFKEHLDK